MLEKCWVMWMSCRSFSNLHRPFEHSAFLHFLGILTSSQRPVGVLILIFLYYIKQTIFKVAVLSRLTLWTLAFLQSSCRESPTGLFTHLLRVVGCDGPAFLLFPSIVSEFVKNSSIETAQTVLRLLAEFLLADEAHVKAKDGSRASPMSQWHYSYMLWK